MGRHTACCLLIWSVAFAPTAAAQTVDFSGTWVLDPDRSTIVPGRGLARMGDGGAPRRLHVTHGANGDVTLLSEVNESQARTYKLGADSPVPVSQDVDLVVRGGWDGFRFVVDGRRDGAAISAVRRVLSLSADGGVLTIEASTTTADGGGTSVLVYTRTTTVPACAEWSTPCRP